MMSNEIPAIMNKKASDELDQAGIGDQGNAQATNAVVKSPEKTKKSDVDLAVDESQEKPSADEGNLGAVKAAVKSSERLKGQDVDQSLDKTLEGARPEEPDANRSNNETGAAINMESPEMPEANQLMADMAEIEQVAPNGPDEVNAGQGQGWRARFRRAAPRAARIVRDAAARVIARFVIEELFACIQQQF